MLTFSADQFAAIAQRVSEERQSRLAQELVRSFPDSFGRVSGEEQMSRLMTLQDLCNALAFNYLRDCARLYAVLMAADARLDSLSDRMDFYAVLTDETRAAQTRLGLLENRFGLTT